MSPKILRRCTICNKFHASYLVEDPAFGKGYLCYDCWKARQAASAQVKPESDPSPPRQEAENRLKEGD